MSTMLTKVLSLWLAVNWENVHAWNVFYTLIYRDCVNCLILQIVFLLFAPLNYRHGHFVIPVYSGLFLSSSSCWGQLRGQRSESQCLKGELAEAEASRRLWKRRHDPHSEVETSRTTAAETGWRHSPFAYFIRNSIYRLLPSMVAARHAGVYFLILKVKLKV